MSWFTPSIQPRFILNFQSLYRGSLISLSSLFHQFIQGLSHLSSISLPSIYTGALSSLPHLSSINLYKGSLISSSSLFHQFKDTKTFLSLIPGHFWAIVNRRRYISHLLIPLFIGTPCITHTDKIKVEIWRDDIHVWYFLKQIYDFLEIFCHRSPKNSLSVISLKYFFNDLFKIHGLWILLNYCLWFPWNTFFMIFHKHFVYDLPKILCLCSPKNILSMIFLKISIKIS